MSVVSVLLLVILFNIIVQAVSVTGTFIVLMYYNTNKAVASHDAVWWNIHWNLTKLLLTNLMLTDPRLKLKTVLLFFILVQSKVETIISLSVLCAVAWSSAYIYFPAADPSLTQSQQHSGSLIYSVHTNIHANNVIYLHSWTRGLGSLQILSLMCVISELLLSGSQTASAARPVLYW